MSYFLARLVERARGTAARIEPIVAPRFAPTAIVEIASEVETPRPERGDQQPTVAEKSSPRAVPHQEAPAKKAEPKILRESDKSSHAATSRFTPAHKSSLPQQPEKLLVPMEKSVVNSTAIVRPSPSADQSVPTVKNGTVTRNSFAISRSKRPQPATPPTTTSRIFERDLLTPNGRPEQPPIVRVTIGRIDVRATPPAVPSRKASARSEPKLTLDAYLKSRREGPR
jgi:hypothetical protein